MWSLTIFTGFAILLALVLVRVWRDRMLADKRAAENEERAAVAEAVHAVSHDVDNLFAVLLGNLSAAQDMRAEEVAEMLADLEPAARAAKDLFHSLRGDRTGVVSAESFATIVRVLVGMQRRRGIDVALEMKGDLDYVGRPGHGFRIVYNLLANAAREVEKIAGGRIEVRLTNDELSIRNPLRPGHTIDDRVFETGVSGYGSSGLGLANAREAAAAIGLAISYLVEGSAVTFKVARAAQPGVEAEPEGQASGEAQASSPSSSASRSSSDSSLAQRRPSALRDTPSSRAAAERFPPV